MTKQGEVEQISLMKPKGEKENDSGLLEYMEDIIGTTGYVSKIEEANIEVEKVHRHYYQELYLPTFFYL